MEQEKILFYFDNLSPANRKKMLQYAVELLKEDGIDPNAAEDDEKFCEENLQDT